MVQLAEYDIESGDTVRRLMDFFKKPAGDTKGEAPEGICANCWGVQEYGDKIRKLYKDRQIDVNNHEKHYAFVKDFVVRYIEGIHLKTEGDHYTCPNCHMHYGSAA